MIIFYWLIGVLTMATLVPSALYVLAYAVTGEQGCIRRARLLWGGAKAFALFGVNLGIWGHVLVALWSIWF